jgi:hypothetical protein
MAGLPPDPQSQTLNSSSHLLIDSHENDERNKNKQKFESNILPQKNRGKSSTKRNSKQLKESEVKQTKQSDKEYLRELYGTDSTKSIEPKKKKKKRHRRRRPVNGFVFISVKKTFLILIQNDFFSSFSQPLPKLVKRKPTVRGVIPKKQRKYELNETSVYKL